MGSIGRAIDTGIEIFESPYVPLVVGAPALRRYCVFGNLFASSGLESDIFRLDRHPTMCQHPITPMDEADIRVHLGRQTRRSIGLLDIVALRDAGYVGHFEALREDGVDIVLFDTLTDEELSRVGELIWDSADEGRTLFSAGSSGLEYALVAHWRATGLIPPLSSPPSAGRVEVVPVVSGSCSPVTADQIAWAASEGFETVELDTPALVTPGERQGEIERSLALALQFIGAGKSVILHSGLGPTDPRIGRTLERIERQYPGQSPGGPSARLIGSALGELLRRILTRSGLRRGATTGGDTSYYMAKDLGVRALEAIAPMAPGSPLCRIWSKDPAIHGCEVTFKGGQVGKRTFLGRVKEG